MSQEQEPQYGYEQYGYQPEPTTTEPEKLPSTSGGERLEYTCPEGDILIEYPSSESIDTEAVCEVASGDKGAEYDYSDGFIAGASLGVSLTVIAGVLAIRANRRA